MLIAILFDAILLEVKTMEQPVLYILMRTDLASLNFGKACAQASHASNAFQHYMQFEMADDDRGPETETLYNQWAASTSQGFGTVLVLGATEIQMRDVIMWAARSDTQCYSGIVHDPTYPLVDGDTVHFIPLDTCAWVFVDKADDIADRLMGHLELHP